LRHANVVVVVAILAAAVGLPPAAVARNAPEERMIDEINRVRAAEAALPALRPAERLGRSAARFSRWLIRNDVFAHRAGGPPGKPAGHTGEALAMHFSRRPNVRGTVRSWLRSPAHRALVLTTSMNAAGIGHARGRFHGRPATIWVLQLARG
jgi:uncharacterized protein YkwD